VCVCVCVCVFVCVCACVCVCVCVCVLLAEQLPAFAGDLSRLALALKHSLPARACADAGAGAYSLTFDACLPCSIHSS